MKSRRDRRKTSFVEGFTLWQVDKPGLRARFTWPLARIDMGDDSFGFALRGPLALLLRPVVVSYSEVSEVRTFPSRLASMIEFRSGRRDVDGAFFVTMNSNFGELLAVFRGHGVDVT